MELSPSSLEAHVIRLILAALTLTACAGTPSSEPEAAPAEAEHAEATPKAEGTSLVPEPGPGQAVAMFAGGCFWCMEKPFDQLEGVLATTSGYTGGELAGVTYKQIGGGTTGHFEAIHVLYDPAVISYARLLEVFWHNVDPTQDSGQFCDYGPQYRTAIFTSDPEEIRLAEESRAKAAETLGAEIVTQILPAGPFWMAEAYHQDFYKKNPEHYLRYRTGCGRDRRLGELWGEGAGH
ncbi:MAG: peptide-methionine (S)-S-oxide reductase MsrA [Alphaproteobacteria bacterium]|nr:peptide-methionine (S)-S-oxide reductase MsrA [Alphaproteobacteria bacterium]